MNILFICTHNRCRSILAEAICNQQAHGKITAFSAGSQPAETIFPFTLDFLQKAGYGTENLHSQSWDDFVDKAIDVVITVCDSAANEPCPVWLGNNIKVHWGLPDPSLIVGSETEAAFIHISKIIEFRIHALLNLDFNKMNPQSLQAELNRIGANNGPI